MRVTDLVGIIVLYIGIKNEKKFIDFDFRYKLVFKIDY